MNKHTLPIVAYQPDQHAEALFRFIEKVLGKEMCERRRRVIETMHTTMPGHDRFPLRHVIVDGDRIAGTLGYMPADFWVNGKRVAVRFTHDLLVDPDYRGAGLGRLIVDNARALGDFFPGGMWMTDPCRKIHVDCGFKDATPLVTYSLVLDPVAFVVRKSMSGLKGLASRTALSASRTFALARARRLASHTSLREVERFDPSMDGAWETLARGYGITRVRDAAYLNWKYSDHPSLDYHNLVAMRADTPTGFLVWRLAPPGAEEKRAVAVDFLTARGDAQTLRRLIARVVVEAHAAGMESVSVLTTQTWAASTLRGLGFMPRAARNTWVVAGWEKVIPYEWLSDTTAWHVCLGDSDGDMWTGSI
ncbi:MAG: GNAT family N-acetyltransferase [Candidatus Krumholzibacteria bacterium]|nr:GNAT family N-acetyltransferase [Candidatus Krumholzibacteria bacterium]MDH4335739.1 GNAT family N-acetyltransferase [Candidatus Krumholzibacteria bacterium]MDH5269265.1 GNAT family N-acetyltransferase [Candidatus Krumholzibacteria bacterium]